MIVHLNYFIKMKDLTIKQKMEKDVKINVHL